MRHDNDIPAQSTFLPLVLSVLVHGAIFGALWLYNPKPKPTLPTGIETGFVSASDIAQVEGAIRENAKQAELQAAAMASQNTPSTNSSNTAQYNDALAQKEAEFQAQIAKFAAQQDAAIQAQMDSFEAQLQDEYAQDHAELQEARQAYAQRDKITEQNKKALDAANQQNKNSQSSSQGNGQESPSVASGNQSSPAPSGTNALTTKSTQSGMGKDSIQQAVARHIRAHWSPIGAEGTRLNTSIRVDANGNVLSVKVTGGTEAQRQSLEDAIYASSPITPIVGTEFRTFSPYFVVQ